MRCSTSFRLSRRLGGKKGAMAVSRLRRSILYLCDRLAQRRPIDDWTQFSFCHQAPCDRVTERTERQFVVLDVEHQDDLGLFVRRPRARLQGDAGRETILHGTVYKLVGIFETFL